MPTAGGSRKKWYCMWLKGRREDEEWGQDEEKDGHNHRMLNYPNLDFHVHRQKVQRPIWQTDHFYMNKTSILLISTQLHVVWPWYASTACPLSHTVPRQLWDLWLLQQKHFLFWNCVRHQSPDLPFWGRPPQRQSPGRWQTEDADERKQIAVMQFDQIFPLQWAEFSEAPVQLHYAVNSTVKCLLWSWNGGCDGTVMVFAVQWKIHSEGWSHF